MAASPFRPANDLLVQYATYHRDRRNIATHFVGIPMIVLAVGVLAARVSVAGIHGAWLLWALSTLWYVTRGQLVLGLATAGVNAVLMTLAGPLAAGDTSAWLAWGLGLFIVGWIIQFVGHWWEGRKPAFADDLVGLLVGPMFVVAEWLMAAGWGADLAAEILQRAGPVRTGAAKVARSA